ncbi:MAG: helix-turn-helix transcriptional regulator [Chloroflexi bacterium]|nr:MAG: helix-turn-helix transcriptional regulator [Chloroflexota bacterium]
MRDQAIGFLSHGDSRVAYAVTGSGPLLLLDLALAHHLEAFWRYPGYRHLVQRLARRFTVVRWDRPGFGLSDRHTVDLSPDGELALVERLVDVLAADEVAIVAAGAAAPNLLRFASRHPDRVSRLGLFGTAAAGRHLVPRLSAGALHALAGVPAPAIHEVAAAAAAAGSEMVELLARTAEADATADAGGVAAPVLVLHRAGDPVVEPGWGRALAARIPNATFHLLEGASHLPYAGDPDPLLTALHSFLVGEDDEPARLSRRELEVAHLVTLGLTNAEIGRRLAIRRRTVDAHLEHIRSKLGVTSRARIAAWLVRDQLASSAQDGA